jgi:glycosyltransferase involved in cell wall biosynthesis
MKSANPLVSVITPTYNRAHVINRALNSVLNQTFQDFEYIIVDDGSKDNTREMINQIIASKGERNKIRFTQHEVNQGQNAALNTGLRLATGKYIAFLDSDDEWLPTMLADQVKQFESDVDVKCSYTWPGYYTRKKKLVPARRYSIKGHLYKDALEQGYICNPTTLMVAKECMDMLGGFKTEFITCQDDDICLRLAKHYKFGLVRGIRAVIYDDAGNQTITNRRVYADDWYKLFNKYEGDILAHCGKATLARHFNKAARLYLEIEDYAKVDEVTKRSNALHFTFDGLWLRAAAGIPIPGRMMYQTGWRLIQHAKGLVQRFTAAGAES